MKKIIAAIIIAAAVVLTACGSEIPENMTQSTYDYGCRALEIMEKYNAAEISGEDAKDRLEGIKKTIDAERENLSDLLESSSALLVSNKAQMFIFAIGGNGSTYKIEKSLREELGK